MFRSKKSSTHILVSLGLALVLSACGPTTTQPSETATPVATVQQSDTATPATNTQQSDTPTPATTTQQSDTATPATGGQSAGTIKFGVPIAQTGALAGLGVPALEGIRFMTKTINDRGGVKVGDKSYTVELVVRDDASTPDNNRALTEQLITQDKVDFLIGGVGTNAVGQGLPVAERYGVPIITTFAYATTVLPKDPKYSFVNVMSTVDQFQGPLGFLKEQGVKDVALVTSNTALGESFAKAMPPLLEENGMRSVILERFEAKTTDFSPVTARLRNVKADALIVEAQAADSYNFRRAEVEQGICFPISVYEYGPNLQPDWPQGTGPAKDGAIGQTFWWGTMKGSQDRWFGDNAGFIKAYKEANGKEPVWASAQGVQSVELMVLAIEAAGKIDRNAVADAILNLQGSTLFGPIRFDPDHFNRGFVKNQMVVQQQGDQAAVIYPPSEATAKYVPQACAKK